MSLEWQRFRSCPWCPLRSFCWASLWGLGRIRRECELVELCIWGPWRVSKGIFCCPTDRWQLTLGSFRRAGSSTQSASSRSLSCVTTTRSCCTNPWRIPTRASGQRWRIFQWALRCWFRSSSPSGATRPLQVTSKVRGQRSTFQFWRFDVDLHFVVGDLLENYCWDDDLINVSRVLFCLTILLTFPLECFVARDVIETIFFSTKQPSTRTRHFCVTFLIVIAAFAVSMVTDCLGVVLELNVSLFEFGSLLKGWFYWCWELTFEGNLGGDAIGVHPAGVVLHPTGTVQAF